MCWDCVHDYGGDLPDSDTPEVRAASLLVADFYKIPGCAVGGPLHIVLDDFNVDDVSLDFCDAGLNDWIENYWEGSAEATAMRGAARAIIAALRPMGLGQRARAVWGKPRPDLRT